MRGEAPVTRQILTNYKIFTEKLRDSVKSSRKRRASYQHRWSKVTDTPSRTLLSGNTRNRKRKKRRKPDTVSVTRMMFLNTNNTILIINIQKI